MTDANYRGERPCPTCGNSGTVTNECAELRVLDTLHVDAIIKLSTALHMATTELEQCKAELAAREAALFSTYAELTGYKRRNAAAEKHLSEFATAHYAIEFGIDLLTGAATGPEVGT